MSWLFARFLAYRYGFSQTWREPLGNDQTNLLAEKLELKECG
jgi:hypothetical protein